MPLIKVNEIKGMTQPKNETLILKSIKQYLQYRGWFVIRIHQGLGCHKGVSDIIALKKGKSVFIEVKTKNGKLSMFQEIFKNNIENNGGEYRVARDIEDVADL
jgi:Holliday junction resolvase